VKKALKTLGAIVLGLCGLALVLFAIFEDVKWLQWVLFGSFTVMWVGKIFGDLETRRNQERWETLERLAKIEGEISVVNRQLTYLIAKLKQSA
jgi:hypothetical protein